VRAGRRSLVRGARAEREGFNITLERSFDRTAGEDDLFPQEITRVLLNLISNGFYAATKRKAEANRGDYAPTLAAATKNLGDRVKSFSQIAILFVADVLHPVDVTVADRLIGDLAA